MFNTNLFDIAIDLSAIYLLLSVVCSTINEWIAYFTKQRAKQLEEGIVRMLAAPQYAESVLNNPLIKNLSQGPGQKPSYIPSQSFSLALIRALTSQLTPRPTQTAPGVPPIAPPAVPADMGNIITAINQLPDGDLKRSLQALLDDARNDYLRFRSNLEQWFNDEMDRVAGWYKRWSQVIVLGAAGAIVLLCNIDTMTIVSRLWADPVLRATIARIAEHDVLPAAGSPQPGVTLPPKSATPRPSPSATATLIQGAKSTPKPNPSAAPTLNPSIQQLSNLSNDLAKVDLPIGWGRPLAVNPALPPWWGWTWAIILKVLGLLTTIIAVSMGAPAWFDILSKLVNVRFAGNPPTGNS